jgi:NADPH:quinone reductase
MLAVWIKDFGPVENLEIRTIPDPPAPTGTQVLVRVKAAGLNRADLLQRRGLYHPPPGYPERIPGMEFAGEVAGFGPDVINFKTDERVFGITAGGAQAEFLLTESSLLTKIPDNVGYAEAGAVPEAFITAHDAAFTQGLLQPGETLLVHAVGSGVGLAALQLAKAYGAKVVGTSRTADKLERCKEFGLDVGIITSGESSFADQIKEQTDGGADVVLDLVGGRYLEGNLKILNQKGRLILVGTTAGAKAELSYGPVMFKRARILGTVLRSRSVEEKALATAVFESFVVPLLKSGAVRANIDKIFPAESIADAHHYLESNASFGKVVIEF